jgi:hypothetical protein
MKQTETFYMRISPEEKAMLAHVARHLCRTQAGAIKWLVRETYQNIKAKEAEETKPNQTEPFHCPPSQKQNRPARRAATAVLT